MKLIVTIVFLLVVLNINAQTAGKLTVTVTTVTYGGSYSPDNVVAIWVQNKTGVYIKTLLAYAATRRSYLSNWAKATSSTYNVVDAVTGATQGSHGIRTCNWNGANQTGTVLGDDTYNVVMEMTEGGNNKLATFAIVKGKSQQIVTPANVAGFSNITIKWTPSTTDLQEIAKLYSVYPVPAHNSVLVDGFDIKEIQILNLSGKYLFSTKERTIDISNLPKGIYLVLVNTGKGNVFKKIIKD
jgi:hypothetical protein